MPSGRTAFVINGNHLCACTRRRLPLIMDNACVIIVVPLTLIAPRGKTERSEVKPRQQPANVKVHLSKFESAREAEGQNLS